MRCLRASACPHACLGRLRCCSVGMCAFCRAVRQSFPPPPPAPPTPIHPGHHLHCRRCRHTSTVGCRGIVCRACFRAARAVFGKWDKNAGCAHATKTTVRSDGSLRAKPLHFFSGIHSTPPHPIPPHTASPPHPPTPTHTPPHPYPTPSIPHPIHTSPHPYPTPSIPPLPLGERQQDLC